MVLERATDYIFTDKTIGEVTKCSMGYIMEYKTSTGRVVVSFGNTFYSSLEKLFMAMHRKGYSAGHIRFN